MYQERAKIHLRAFIISKIFQGLYPRTPVAGGVDLLPHPPPARLCCARGLFAPRLRRPRCIVCTPMLSLTPQSLKSWEIAWIFPDQFKSCSVHPLLKKPNLNREDLGNYRPVSNLSFLSKLTESIAKNRLMNHLSSNKLLNSFQSVYLKSHATETTLASVHDHIVRAMSLQQVSCLCLLDLSAAFDTIDHSILIHRLSSWFGINGCALSWVKSYLSNRSFYVNLTGTKSSVFQLLYGFPQGSVLGPLLFILYTTLLNHIISISASNNHLYADDTQLYVFPCH
jgi:hypothetical protein